MTIVHYILLRVLNHRETSFQTIFATQLRRVQSPSKISKLYDDVDEDSAKCLAVHCISKGHIGCRYHLYRDAGRARGLSLQRFQSSCWQDGIPAATAIL